MHHGQLNGGSATGRRGRSYQAAPIRLDVASATRKSATNRCLRRVVTVAAFIVLIGLQVVRLILAAIFALMEPLLRVTLVPLAFLGFCVTLLFGFLLRTPGYPRWGMLALSVSFLLTYWLVLWFMSLLVPLPPHHDR